MTYKEELEYRDLNVKYTHPLIDLMAKKVQTDIDLLRSYVELARERKAIDKITYLGLTLDEIRALDTMLDNNEKRKLKKNMIYLYLNNPTEISFEEYKRLTETFGIYSVIVNGLVKTAVNEYDEFANNIDSKLWYEYLKNLYRLTNGIKDFFSNDSSCDREKKMFSILCKRLVESVTYELEAEETFNKNSKFHSDSATNEIVGIISGRCVCRGYAGIIRDGSAVLGIDAPVMYGSNGVYGHAWNQVKLDGVWYNTDVTWDAENILENLDTFWFLKSDEDFDRYGIITDEGNIFHKSYSIDRSVENVCKCSVSEDKIKEYLNLEEKKKRTWLERVLQSVKDKNWGGKSR